VFFSSISKMNSLLKVLSLAPLGTETKTHSNVLLLGWAQQVFVYGFPGGVPGIVLMDVACMESGLKLDHFGVSPHFPLPSHP